MDRQVEVPDGFPQRKLWKDLLSKWCEFLRKYESNEPDVAYWHCENSLTGLLGAAAWALQDGWSLQEFSTKRKSKSGDGLGYGDLRIGRGESKATAEAKLYWLAETIRTAKKYLLEYLDEAAEQLKAVNRKNRVGDPVSVCYVVPWFDAANGNKRGVDAIENLEAWARTESLATAKHIAASSARTRSKDREYPGVLLVARAETWNGT